jgi:hypothetical protein
MLGVEPLDFAQFDVGVLGPGDGLAGDPPLGAGQTCRQVCASSWIMSLLWPTTPGDDFAVSGLPQPDRLSLVAQHDGVIPTPQHYIGTARHLSEGYQVTRRNPPGPRRREMRCVPDGGNLTLGQYLADILFGTQDDPAAISPSLPGDPKLVKREAGPRLRWYRKHPRYEVRTGPPPQTKYIRHVAYRNAYFT